MAAPPPINVSSMALPTPNFFATPAPKPPQPSAVLKIDASMSILPPPSAQIHTQDMKELAEAFVREEVERQKRTNGVTISKTEQDMMRNAFLAGMQHSPDEKDQSTADLRWEFDQSESLDAMGFSFDDAEDLNNLGSSFDGLIEGHGIHPTAIRRPDPSRISGGLRTPVAGSSGHAHHFGHSFHGSTEASAWSGINTSDIIDTDVNDMSLSMSMLNMSLDVEESQDQIVSASDVAGIFSSD